MTLLFRSRVPGIAEGALWFAVLFLCLLVVGLFLNSVTDRREDPGMLPTPLRQINDVATLGAAACLALFFLALVVAGIAAVA